MKRLIRKQLRKKSLMTDIPLTPLIDTALTLLIIFMITAPMMNNSVNVQLPQGSVKEDSSATQDLALYINKNHDIVFKDKNYEKIQDVIQLLSKSFEQDQQKTIHLYADESVSYGNVMEVVDAIKNVRGIKYVALATKNKH